MALIFYCMTSYPSVVELFMHAMGVIESFMHAMGVVELFMHAINF